MKKITLSNLLLILLIALVPAFKANAQGSAIGNPHCLPGFTDDLISNGWSDLRQVTFDSTGRMFVVEAQGKVYIVDTNGVKQTAPLIDISEEVGWWVSHGLLGMALDKDFLTNGYFYLMYTVDRHYLLYYGTPQYSKDSDLYHDATITRVTRFKADSSANFTTTVPGSRFVLLGTDKTNGVPVTYNNHDGGCIRMSQDGSLLISTGDGGHGGKIDTGSQVQTYYLQALADTILIPATNVGAFRSQQIQALSGKVLRIDPMTGLGLSTNPFYDSAHPEAVRSKVWALGVRQPFRFSVRPGTSAINNMNAGQPGVIFLGNVGFFKWEDIDIIRNSGLNFGWPIYEGMFPHGTFSVSQVQNMFTPNPQYGTGGCTQQYFRFIDLMINATLDTNPLWPNPCNTSVQIPSSTPTFIRTRPGLSYYHNDSTAYVPTFSGFNPTVSHVGSAGSPASGVELEGHCTTGTAWYPGDTYPALFKNRMFYSELVEQYICSAVVDSNNNITAIDTFATQMGDCISLMYNPKDEALYYIEYPYEIHRIRYTLGINVAPTAKGIQDVQYGPGPLTVNFDASESTDPENGPLTYAWDFGDGNTSTLVAPQHIFSPATSAPTEYNVNLTVTDTGGLSNTAHLIVSVNNTPPVVQITSPIDGTWYSDSIQQVFNLTANVTDAEQGPSQLHYQWYTSLHHNTHQHPNPIDTDVVTTLFTDPEDCENSYSYEITLTVTDDAGLSGSNTVYIYQACPPIVDLMANKVKICQFDTVAFTSTIVGHADSLKWIFQSGTPATSNVLNPMVVYNTGWSGQNVTLIGYNPYGTDTAYYPGLIFVKISPNVNQNITGNLISCTDDSVLLFTVNDSIYTYQWLYNGIPIPGATSYNYTADSSGIYNVIVEQNNHCKKTTTPVNYFEDVIGTDLTLSGSNILCNTDSVIISAATNSSYGYQWYLNGNLIPGANSAALPATATGSYYVVIHDTNNCQATSMAEAIIKTPESSIVYTTDSIICPAGDVVIMNADTGTGFTYQWYMNGSIISGATGITYTAAIAGLYCVVVSDSNGCSHMSNILGVTDCTGIKDPAGNNVITLYPNPVSNVLYVIYPSYADGNATIKIMDALGKTLGSQKFESKAGKNTVSLKTASLQPGVYEIVVETDRINLTRRFIKE